MKLKKILVYRLYVIVSTDISYSTESTCMTRKGVTSNARIALDRLIVTAAWRSRLGRVLAGKTRQLGVEVNPPPEPVTGINGAGTVSVGVLGSKSTAGSAGFGIPGSANTAAGKSGGASSGPMSAGRVARGPPSGGNMRGTIAASGIPSASA